MDIWQTAAVGKRGLGTAMCGCAINIYIIDICPHVSLRQMGGDAGDAVRKQSWSISFLAATFKFLLRSTIR